MRVLVFFFPGWWRVIVQWPCARQEPRGYGECHLLKGSMRFYLQQICCIHHERSQRSTWPFSQCYLSPVCYGSRLSSSLWV